MASVLTALPEIHNQHEFNRDCWRSVMEDKKLASLEQRIETDQFGNVVMMPPPGFGHSCLQGQVMELLRDLMITQSGRVLPECPVSTSGGVKGLDVVWISKERIEEAVDGNLLMRAPEICIEILSPGNTRDEITTKKRLYFEAGADEVWLCSGEGHLSFYRKSDEDISASQSEICPEFPDLLE